MIYIKPKNVRYTDMAIYIDSHIYTDDCDDELVYKYLYFLISMLAHKHKLFNRAEYYDDFSLTTATYVFMRLKNEKQYQLDDKGNPKLAKIKSCLNYIKTILYPRKVAFEQEYYSKAIDNRASYDPECVESTYGILDIMLESVDGLNNVEFSCCLEDIISSIKHYINKIPYKADKTLMNNIYVSCLLTFLNSITLTNKDKNRISNLKYNVKDSILYQIYRAQSKDSVILYHLDESLHDYIYVLTNEIKHLISKDLSQVMDTYIPSDSNMISMFSDYVSQDY